MIFMCQVHRFYSCSLNIFKLKYIFHSDCIDLHVSVSILSQVNFSISWIDLAGWVKFIRFARAIFLSVFGNLSAFLLLIRILLWKLHYNFNNTFSYLLVCFFSLEWIAIGNLVTTYYILGILCYCFSKQCIFSFLVYYKIYYCLNFIWVKTKSCFFINFFW